MADTAGGMIAIIATTRFALRAAIGPRPREAKEEGHRWARVPAEGDVRLPVAEGDTGRPVAAIDDRPHGVEGTAWNTASVEQPS